ncbi:hypothetical protein ACFQS2_02025 [Brachybacterium sp. GCM10030267]|uniref:hypothetical protein n=1 Tax=Brachybacterium sp. GCM10030267 TaxID=3273381 RepID=UPI0036073782
MTSRDASARRDRRAGRPPARAWLRPGLLAVGGLAVAAALVVADQLIAAIALALFALFMAFWTSPLRSGPHTPLATALQRRADDVSIILWAPGNPLSARMQTAIRTPREDVLWVNAYRDPEARALLDEHGGEDALPLVIVGQDVKATATVGDLLDMQAAGRRRAAGEDDGELDAGATGA